VKQLTVGGVEIAYLDEGKGPVVILGHCSSASHKEWLPLIETLKADWRVLAPDFIGYGQSGAWPAEQPCAIDADVAVLLSCQENEGASSSGGPFLRGGPGA